MTNDLAQNYTFKKQLYAYTSQQIEQDLRVGNNKTNRRTNAKVEADHWVSFEEYRGFSWAARSRSDIAIFKKMFALTLTGYARSLLNHVKANLTTVDAMKNAFLTMFNC